VVLLQVAHNGLAAAATQHAAQCRWAGLWHQLAAGLHLQAAKQQQHYSCCSAGLGHAAPRGQPRLLQLRCLRGHICERVAARRQLQLDALRLGLLLRGLQLLADSSAVALQRRQLLLLPILTQLLHQLLLPPLICG
jgi:hypothetical protein